MNRKNLFINLSNNNTFLDSSNGGFTALFDALKRGAVIPAIAGPMIMYGLREDSAQTGGATFPRDLEVIAATPSAFL